ncbi:hypothetical protein LTR10_017354 [Elasticomyces elasticus]|uniref:Uncharacterized protein n=1 Tax=Exophiala sideris TaxID=1016849 RepID=A0ABR0J965_9EURO|nr:hypothetical protein LTR10_017354 [Elasticomyces elasticus]KAK5027888.1 hypothetical protein LTS07_006764 [Exophiala sideris]KAK5037522.1 hypothetical protein LTR13_004679 [Exophiala sideris]KAK5059183.1 hypothetical protein LTR69_006472 [Exophiala sideris]KAK5183017.1 hypothetical protein LTR44_004727 [Eurotiomycetes sp. CCFEE 6388]
MLNGKSSVFVGGRPMIAESAPIGVFKNVWFAQEEEDQVTSEYQDDRDRRLDYELQQKVPELDRDYAKMLKKTGGDYFAVTGLTEN